MPGFEQTDLHERLAELLDDAQSDHAQLEALASTARAEIGLPVDAFVQLEGLDPDAVSVCADLDQHIFNPEHTDPRVVDALRGTHWIDVRELPRD